MKAIDKSAEIQYLQLNSPELLSEYTNWELRKDLCLLMHHFLAVNAPPNEK